MGSFAGFKWINVAIQDLTLAVWGRREEKMMCYCIGKDWAVNILSECCRYACKSDAGAA
jgi:hypothetical protein